MMGIAASRPARVTNIGLSFVPQTTMKVAKYTKQVFSGSGQQHRAMILNIRETCEVTCMFTLPF